MAAIHIDDLASPRLPFALRALNALGGPITRCDRVARSGRPARGRVRAHGARTTTATRASASRSPCCSTRSNATRSSRRSGRIGARGLVLQLLANRLRIEDLFRRHPEIDAERIERPIIIAGLPRTGTTHLHNLISQDPSLRSLPYWESLEPVPDPREAPGADGRDPRVVRCEKALAFVHRVMPLFPLMHEMTAEARHEEIQLLAIEFSTMLFESSYSCRAMRPGTRRATSGRAYRYWAPLSAGLQWLARTRSAGCSRARSTSSSRGR